MSKWYQRIAAFALVSGFVVAACSVNGGVNDGLASGAKTMSSNEKATLFKMILDHPELQQYLHPEVAQRVPVRVKSNAELGSDLAVEKFGQTIKFVDGAGVDEDLPVLEVVTFEISEDRVDFLIRYEVEGVTLRGVLAKEADEWTFEAIEIVET